MQGEVKERKTAKKEKTHCFRTFEPLQGNSSRVQAARLEVDFQKLRDIWRSCALPATNEYFCIGIIINGKAFARDSDSGLSSENANCERSFIDAMVVLCLFNENKAGQEVAWYSIEFIVEVLGFIQKLGASRRHIQIKATRVAQFGIYYFNMK